MKSNWGVQMVKEKEKKVDINLVCNMCGYIANKPDELEDHKKKLCPKNTTPFRPRGSGGQPLGGLTGKYRKV